MSRWKCRCCPGQLGALRHVTVNTATMADLLRGMRNAWQPLSTGAPVLDRDEQWPAHHVEGRLASRTSRPVLHEVPTAIIRSHSALPRQYFELSAN